MYLGTFKTTDIFCLLRFETSIQNEFEALIEL